MKKMFFAVTMLLFAQSNFAAVVGRDVEYPAGDKIMKGFLAMDDSVRGKRAGILVVPEWWGVNDYARKRARMLAAEGYVALVVDMYGDGKIATNPKEAGELAGSINKNPPLALARFQAAEKNPSSRCARRRACARTAARSCARSRARRRCARGRT